VGNHQNYAQATGASSSQIGLILDGYPYVTTIFQVPFGMVTYKLGHRRMLIANGQSPVILLGLMTSCATIFRACSLSLILGIIVVAALSGK
jgi:hypothetical protein